MVEGVEIKDEREEDGWKIGRDKISTRLHKNKKIEKIEKR